MGVAKMSVKTQIRNKGAATVPIVTHMRMTNPAVSILRVFKLAPRFFC